MDNYQVGLHSEYVCCSENYRCSESFDVSRRTAQPSAIARRKVDVVIAGRRRERFDSRTISCCWRDWSEHPGPVG
jgi:hypothetical protein